MNQPFKATNRATKSPSGGGMGISTSGEGLRIRSLSLARGFTVFFIPVIHSIMLYGNQQTQLSGMASFLTFIAEWPGAQLFMILMGIHFSLSKNKSLRPILFRSLMLLSAAYLLNLLKFTFPHSLGLLPPSFANDIRPVGYPLILLNDILHFASMALFVLYIIKKLPEYPVIAIILAFIICFASPQFVIPNGDEESRRDLANYLSQLSSGQPPHTYFPLLPWLAYPLTGLAIGYYIKKEGSKTFLVLLLVGLGLMALGFWIGSSEPPASFYRLGPWKTIQHLGFVCCWLTIWHIISRLLKSNIFFTFLEFLSRSITLIYLIQWPLICWLLPIVGYHKLNIAESILVSLTISLPVFGLAHLIIFKYKKHYLSSRH